MSLFFPISSSRDVEKSTPPHLFLIVFLNLLPHLQSFFSPNLLSSSPFSVSSLSSSFPSSIPIYYCHRDEEKKISKVKDGVKKIRK